VEAPVTQTFPPESDAEAARRRVLDAAEAVFAERGYAGATTREIAVRAGIGKRMLFYYFPNKGVLYRAVLDRVIVGVVEIAARFQGNPGPVGLAHSIEEFTHFAAHNVRPLNILTREIMDGGHHLKAIASERLQPIFAHGCDAVARNMADGVFRPGDPMHVLMDIAGVTLYYFLMIPLLQTLWQRDPLAPETIAERAASARDLIMHGLMAFARDGKLRR
jgi:TetR/AcrR family transcriptional regulator